MHNINMVREKGRCKNAEKQKEGKEYMNENEYESCFGQQ